MSYVLEFNRSKFLTDLYDALVNFIVNFNLDLLNLLVNLQIDLPC